MSSSRSCLLAAYGLYTISLMQSQATCRHLGNPTMPLDGENCWITSSPPPCPGRVSLACGPLRGARASRVGRAVQEFGSLRNGG